MFYCRVCGEAIRRSEGYRLIRVQGGREAGRSYHHEYAHIQRPLDIAQTCEFASRSTQVVSEERKLLCLAVCFGVTEEELRELAALGGLRTLL